MGRDLQKKGGMKHGHRHSSRAGMRRTYTARHNDTRALTLTFQVGGFWAHAVVGMLG